MNVKFYIDGNEMTLTEVNTSLTDSNQIYFKISKEYVTELFKQNKTIPRNIELKEDYNYACGEVQYIFDKENSLEEVLIFVVYESDKDIINGEFIYAPNSFLDKKIINKIKETLL